jgi:phosphoribosylformimino-5-aminoimidazole carboxamide ribotide isomerase
VKLYPAIDLRGGRCVRLRQGDYAVETVYGDDPVAQARAYVDAGAEWIHVVDLDAALTGEPANRSAIAAIAATVPIPVQTGGGVRTIADARELADAGVARVVLGTAAIERPELVDEVAAVVPVALGLDVRGREVAVRGWTQEYGHLDDVLARFAGRPYEALVVTQIATDGTGEGPDVELYGELLAAGEPLVASGGVGTLDHLRALVDLGVGGVIVGRALYEQAFTLEEALAACTSPA